MLPMFIFAICIMISSSKETISHFMEKLLGSAKLDSKYVSTFVVEIEQINLFMLDIYAKIDNLA